MWEDDKIQYIKVAHRPVEKRQIRKNRGWGAKYIKGEYIIILPMSFESFTSFLEFS